MAIQTMADRITRMPWLEISSTALLLVLALITVFRKKLSTNHEYRSLDLRPQKKGTPNLPAINFGSILQRVRNQDTSSIQSGQKCSITHLTQELLFHIADYLDTESIVRLSACNHSLRRDLLSDSLWRNLFQQTLQPILTHPVAVELLLDRGISWSPSMRPVVGSWFRFYVVLEAVWSDFLCAGYSTSDVSIVAIDDKLFNVTSFLALHPGSPETLAEHSGADVGELFEDIGHSSFAREQLKQLLVLDPSASPASSSSPSSSLSSVRSLRGTSKSAKSVLRRRARLLADRARHHVFQRSCGKIVPRLQYWGEHLCETATAYGYEDIAQQQTHSGNAHVCFDVFQWRWLLWFTCCGRVYPCPLPRDPSDEVEDEEVHVTSDGEVVRRGRMSEAESEVEDEEAALVDGAQQLGRDIVQTLMRNLDQGSVHSSVALREVWSEEVLRGLLVPLSLSDSAPENGQAL